MNVKMTVTLPLVIVLFVYGVHCTPIEEDVRAKLSYSRVTHKILLSINGAFNGRFLGSFLF